MDGKVAHKQPNGTQLNGNAPSPKPRYQRKRRPGFLSTVFSVSARILIWTAIINVLFRCPSTPDQCDDSSPYGCKEYFKVKEIVSPHLQPYYDTHVSPYVDLAAPYYQALDRAVITPTQTYTRKYASPLVAYGNSVAQKQWEKIVQPQIETARVAVKAKYNETIAPHVTSFGDTASPYIDIARTSALQTYHDLVLPTYVFMQPYAIQGYNAASAFATNTALPSAIWAFNKTWLFLDDAILPQLRLIYVQTVEPQLVRIGQRLGRYSGGGKTKMAATEPISATATATRSFFAKPSPMLSSAASSASTATHASPASVSTASASSKVASSSPASAGEVSATSSPRPDLLVQPPPIVEGESESRKQVREEITEDLISWQDKFMAAAENGAAEIKDRLVDICERMTSQETEITGKQTVRRFVDTVDSELAALRLEIMSIVDTNTDKAEAIEQVNAAVRRVGLDLRDKAHKIRAWRENFESDIHASINEAARDHFAMIDSVKDLALQKIGMKWAWLDGVTYKDWKLFHLLKAEFQKWKDGLEESIVTHPALEKAKNAASDVEDDGMVLAKDAALELKRLKEVGHFKVIAGDSTNDFNTERMEKAALAVELAESGGSAEAPIEPETPQAGDAGGEFLEPEAPQSKNPEAQVKESLLWDDTEATLVEEEASFSTQVEHNENKSLWDDAPEAKHSMVGNADEVTESTNDIERSDLVTEEAPPEALMEPIEQDEKQIVLDTRSSALDDAGEEDKLPPPASSPTAEVKPALFGAAAQIVPGRAPVLDDDEEDATALTAVVTSIAHAAYSTAVSLASQQSSLAMSIVSAQIGATPKPVHQEMLASVSSVFDQAMASASSRLSEGLKAAESMTVPTPTSNPVAEQWTVIESIAVEKLGEGRAWAEAQYESAKIAVGLATPTPTSQTAKLMEQAKLNYYAGLGFAQARYEEFVAAAFSALSSMTAEPTPTGPKGTASSMASAATESAASMASAASSKMSSAASVASESIESAGSVAAENISHATGAVSESFEDILSMLSVQVYGQPTPTMWYEPALATASSVASDAANAVTEGVAAATGEAKVKFEEVSSLISELVVGKEPPFTESVFSRLSSAYGQATESAASMASAASASVSSAVSKATEAGKSMKDEL